MNTYKIFYSGKEAELEAPSLYAASTKAVELFKVPMSKRGLLSVILVAVEGEQIVHSTAEF